MSDGREIRLFGEDDGWWSAIDEETGVASQGEIRQKAVENLNEAVELTNEVRDNNSSAPEPDAPWFERMVSRDFSGEEIVTVLQTFGYRR